MWSLRSLNDHVFVLQLLADAIIYAQKNSSWKLFIWPSGPCDG